MFEDNQMPGIIESMDSVEVNIFFGALVLSILVFQVSPTMVAAVIGIAVIGIVVRKVMIKSAKDVATTNADSDEYVQASSASDGSVRFA